MMFLTSCVVLPDSWSSQFGLQTTDGSAAARALKAVFLLLAPVAGGPEIHMRGLFGLRCFQEVSVYGSLENVRSEKRKQKKIIL